MTRCISEKGLWFVYSFLKEKYVRKASNEVEYALKQSGSNRVKVITEFALKQYSKVGIG